MFKDNLWTNRSWIASSQSELIKMLQNQIDENKRVGSEMRVVRWNSIFRSFYNLPSEFADEYVFDLIEMMKDEGSCAVPDVCTFKTILLGIAENHGLADAEKLTRRIMRDIETDYNITQDTGLHAFDLLYLDGWSVPRHRKHCLSRIKELEHAKRCLEWKWSHAAEHDPAVLVRVH